MKLNEIEMDLPYKKNKEIIYKIMEEEGKEYKEAVRLDYESNWKNKRREFQLSTRCMTSMIERIMIPIKTKDCWKIIFECVEEEGDEVCCNLLGVYHVQILFNLKDYLKLDNYDKKKKVINSILVGLEQAANQIPFEVTNIVEACLQIVKKEYHNEWKWKKPLKIKEKKVQIQITHDVDAVYIYVISMDLDDNIIDKQLVISTYPDEWSYSTYLGKMEKNSDDMVVLISKEGERFPVKI